MSEWKECPKCKCMNLNRQHCVDCGRDLKEVAPENQQPPQTAEAKPDCAPRSGSVTPDALIVAFVQGAKWWEYHQTGATMWASDQDQAEGRAEEMARNGILGKSPNAEVSDRAGDGDRS